MKYFAYAILLAVAIGVIFKIIELIRAIKFHREEKVRIKKVKEKHEQSIKWVDELIEKIPDETNFENI